jgi:hypothetical protein
MTDFHNSLFKKRYIPDKIIILHFVLYGHVTCSLTFKAELRVRDFENRVLRRKSPLLKSVNLWVLKFEMT